MSIARHSINSFSDGEVIQNTLPVLAFKDDQRFGARLACMRMRSANPWDDLLAALARPARVS